MFSTELSKRTLSGDTRFYCCCYSFAWTFFFCLLVKGGMRVWIAFVKKKKKKKRRM